MTRRKSPYIVRIAAACTVGVALTVVVAGAQASPRKQAEESRQKLDVLRAKLDVQRLHLRELSQKERNIVITLSDVERNVIELDAGIAQAEESLAALSASRKEREAAVAKQDERGNALVAQLNRRMREAYTEGEGSGLRHILGASSFTDYAYRRRYLQVRAEGDALLVATLNRTRAEIKTQRDALAEAESEAKTLTMVLEQSREALKTSQAARHVAIAEIESEKLLALKLVDDNVAAQKDAQRELAALLKKAPSRRKRRSGALSLLRPVVGPIIQAFGTVKDKRTGAKVTSNGISIKAKLGTPVVAPAAGTVVFQGVMRGFGLLVILDVGDKTHVLLGHLSRATVQRGDVLNVNQKVGFVGDTGSTEGAKLYLEVRRKGRPLNPIRFLTR